MRKQLPDILSADCCYGLLLQPLLLRLLLHLLLPKLPLLSLFLLLLLMLPPQRAVQSCPSLLLVADGRDRHHWQ
jgi:hypothetical protein